MGFLDDLLRGAQDVASRAYDQVNPWDDGKDWNKRTARPAPRQQQRRPQPQQQVRQQPGQLSPQAHQRLAQTEEMVRRSQANVMSPMAMFEDVFKSGQQAMKAGGDMAVGFINDSGERVANAGERGAEAIREFTGQNQAEYENMNKRADDYRNIAKQLAAKAQAEQDPARRERLIQGIKQMQMAEMETNMANEASIQRGMDALDPRKMLVDSGMTALDVATLGKGKVIMEGLQAVAKPVTRQVAGRLVKNTTVTGAQTGGLGAGYAGLETARDPNATAQDYFNNMKTGAALGAGLGVGAQIAMPVIGQVAKQTAKGTVNVANATRKEITKANRRQQESVYRAAAQDKILTRVEPHYIQPSGKQLDQGIVSQHRAAIINGQIDPIIVTQNANKTMKILDGEHRYQAYKELGFPQVPTRVVTPSEVRMMKSGGSAPAGMFDPTGKLGKKERIEKGKGGDNPVLDSLNPTGGVFVGYNPKARAEATLAKNITTLDKTSGGNADDMISIYRGAPSSQKTINPGDFVTTNKQLAQDYGGNVIEQKVRKGDVLDDINEPLGDEYIYRPNSDKTPTTEKTELNENGSIVTPGRQFVTDTQGNTVKQPTAKDKILASKPAEFLYGDKKPVQKAQLKFSKRIKQAEDDFINGKINSTKLEAIRKAEETGMPLRKRVVAARDLNTKQYIKEQTKAQKAASKTGMGLKEKTADAKEKFVDDLAPIEDRLNKAIKQGVSVDPKDHITYQLDRSRRAEGVMNAYVRDNGLDKVIQNVKNTDEFDQYLIARHAKELDEEIKTGRDARKDAALVKQLDGKYKEAAKELYKYNQKLLDTSVEYGLISKATATSLKKKYPEYVPFNRIFNEDELNAISGGTGKGNASNSSQSVVQKLKGSERAIASPLNSIIDKTRIVVEQGERNKAAQILASYKDLEGNPFNLREMSPKETIGAKHTIAYLDNGKKRVFETDKDIADAAKNMTREEIGLWVRIISFPNRALRGGATTMNVGFAGANVVKDVMGAAINSRHVFRIVDPEVMGKSLAAALHHNGKYYHELMREGITGTSFDMYRNPLKSNVKELRSHKNIGTRAAYNVTHPGQWLRTFENTIGRSEDFGRALQYYSNKKGYKADGKNDLDATILAADQARSNSTNFFRHGSVGKHINKGVPYWNAGVQGARIMGKRTRQRPVQTLAKLGFVIAAPSAVIAMNNYADEKKREVMANIPDYEKEGNIIIVGDDATYNPKTNKWENVTKIPVPPQHMGVHMSIQNAIKSAFTGEAMDHAKNIGRVVEDYTTINPTNPSETLTRHIPQALKLVAEPMTNTNMYTGNKIVPDSQKNLPAADQYNEYTSGTAKVLGKATNTSPRMIDNGIRTGLGGAGQNAVNLTDSALAAMGLIKKEEVQGKSFADSIAGRFSGANAISPADRAEKKLEDFKKQVTSTDAYKNASQYDKGRMLNRLESDVKAVEYDKAPPKEGQEKNKLTKKQQSLANDGFKVDTYTDLSEKSTGTEVSKNLAKDYKKTLEEFDNLSTEEKEKKLYKENDAEYRYELAKYENKKASGTLSKVDTIKKEAELARLEAGSKFPKEIRDLYTLNKTQMTALINNGELTEKQAEQIIAYGDALKNAGSSNKFRDSKGNVSLALKAKGGSSKKSTGKKSTGKGSTAKGKIPASDDNSSTISLVANLSKKVANTKVAKRQLPKNGGISAPGIKAYKKVAKTNVSMTRRT